MARFWFDYHMQACPTGGFDLLMGGKYSLSSLRVRLSSLEPTVPYVRLIQNKIKLRFAAGIRLQVEGITSPKTHSTPGGGRWREVFDFFLSDKQASKRRFP
jgi:hypothetical protein